MENRFLQAMMFRHATKEFDATKKISEEDFKTILEIGRLSPSSFGLEPWKFLVVQNEELREKMKEFSWGALSTLPNASHFVIILARKKSMKYGSEYTQHMLRDVQKLPENVVALYNQFYEKFQKEDFNILENDRTLFDWATKQTYIAMANMMTGASYIGIDSCPIEGFDMVKAESFLKNELKIDIDEFGLSSMISFGYRAKEPREKTRQKLESVVAYF